MPALERALGVEAVVGHPRGDRRRRSRPTRWPSSLAFMIPAMNLDDRTELLAGMRMAAPPEAFDGVVGLARSVLDPADFAALADRLGVG